MIKSMTGFGKSEFEINNKKITIEIKSLNSKQTDINARIPQLYREKEIEIRRDISEKLVRGKIDLSIFVENLGETGNAIINEKVVKNYFDTMSHISDDLEVPVNECTLQMVMRFPDTIKIQYEQLDEKEWGKLYVALHTALRQVDEFRTQEGAALRTDLLENVDNILRLKKELEPFEQQRIENVRTRLSEALESLKMNGNIDATRFEQELIFYLERLDFNEEKVRLVNHCNYFKKTMDEREANGKKLSFIAQEIGREINTLGSKANESNIQHIVVHMKDSLEKIKEQILNVL
ncbi:MAG: YicC family protein [Prolixibacteraceae bacterium]|nr:YicC family protein [Prolixibacteraceae bacterium]